MKDAERNLKISQGHANVWKSKAEKALEHEKILLAEVKRAADDMQCKLLPAAGKLFRLSFRYLSILLMFQAFVWIHARKGAVSTLD